MEITIGELFFMSATMVCFTGIIGYFICYKITEKFRGAPRSILKDKCAYCLVCKSIEPYSESTILILKEKSFEGVERDNYITLIVDSSFLRGSQKNQLSYKDIPSHFSYKTYKDSFLGSNPLLILTSISKKSYEEYGDPF
ncbi:MAG: hypothetical protein KAJ58_03005 [Candidatus Pacebacteria bacterium]|nr:hypothetical protein [Candidatus Paceibacterota bacterium]